MKGTCPECGQFAGGHFAGCPEDDGADEDELETPEIEPDPDADSWRDAND